VSDRKIWDIIRRHYHDNANTTGTWTHAEIQEIIAASRDAQGICSQSRADLLYLVSADGRNPMHAHSEITPEDESALKKAALAGIETAERFKQLSPYKQADFVKNCVLLQSADAIGFKLLPARPRSLSPAIIELTHRAYEHALEIAGAKQFAKRPVLPRTSVLRRNGETYCYVVACSFAANNISGEWSFTAMLDVCGRFFRTLFDGFVPYEDE
jgi:hypothetical protein